MAARCFFNPIVIIQQHGLHQQHRSSFPLSLSSVGSSSAPFAFLSSWLLLLHVRSFFPASSEVFKSSVLSPSHASLAAISTSTSSGVSRAVHHPSPVELPSPPIKLSLSPFPSYITPPPLSPPRQSTPTSVCLSLPNHPPDPASAKMPPQRPTHTRLHVQNTFDALKVLVSRPRPTLPTSSPHSASTPRKPLESACCH